MELSVVIPCLNEEKTISICIRKALSAMQAHNIQGEVVVSDNGSTDNSIQVSTEAGARVVNCPSRGYGAALIHGFTEAYGEFVIMGDADDSYDFGEIAVFVDKLRAGSNFVMGTRLKGRVEPGAMPFLNRYLGTPVLTMILNFLFGTRISDCNCGMRGFRRNTIQSLGLSSSGMEFASEMIVKSAIHGVKIDEVPITLHKDKRDRAPHLRPWRDGWRHLRLLLWYAPDKAMFFPGLVLMITGLLLCVSQVSGPIRAAGFLMDIHFLIIGLALSLVGLSGVLSGLQAQAQYPDLAIRKSPTAARLARTLSFDRLVGLGVTVGLSGAVLLGYVVYCWLSTRFGPFDSQMTRITILGSLMSAVGIQLLTAALAIGTASVASKR